MRMKHMRWSLVYFALILYSFSARGEAKVWITGNDAYYHNYNCNRVSKSAQSQRKPRLIDKEQAVKQGWRPCPYCIKEPEHVTGAVKPTSTTLSRAQLKKTYPDQVLAKRELRDQAYFEARLERWRKLSESERRSFRDELVRAQSEALAAHSAVLSSRQDSLAQARKKVALSKELEAAEVSKQYDDDPLKRSVEDFEDSHLRKAIVSDFVARRGTFQQVGSPRRVEDVLRGLEDSRSLLTTDLEVASAERKMIREMERVEGNVEATRVKHAQVRRQYWNEIGSLSVGIKASEIRATYDLSWYDKELALLQALDQALSDGYEPQLRSKVIRSWKNLLPQTTELFEVRADVWKIDWTVSGNGIVQIKVHSSSGITQLPETKAPGGNFHIVDRPGEFRLEIDSQGGAVYSIEVSMISR